MSNESNFSQADSLEIIQSMINKAKNRFNEDGKMYLLWGWLVLLCSLAEFILLTMVHYRYHYVVWLLCWVLGLYQFIYLARQKRHKVVHTYTDDILKYVWIVFVISMFLFAIVFGSVLGDSYYRLINPGFLALYGMPTFLSGVILKFRPLIIGAIGCWCLSVLSTVTPYEYQLLLVSAAMLIAWIIPGYLLKAKYIRSNS